jgi:hypothetical protein
MENEFIPYEQALALKELGFDEPCFAVYIDKTLIMEDDWLYSTNQDTFIESCNFTAPLYQQAFRWFREKYKVDSIIQPTYSTKYQYRMFHIEGKTKVQIYGEYMGKEFKTYEEAELACLIKLIEITKTK